MINFVPLLERARYKIMGLFRKKKQEDVSAGTVAPDHRTDDAAAGLVPDMLQAENHAEADQTSDVCTPGSDAPADQVAADQMAEGQASEGHGITVDDMFKFLKKEGFLPQKDESDETSIEFKYQGTAMRMEISDGDYIRLMTFLTLDPDDVNYFDILIASSQVMLELRMVKVMVGEKWILFSIETLASSLEEYSGFFIRYLDILMAALSKHREVYSGYQESRKDGDGDSQESGDADESPLDKILQEVVASQANNPMKN